MPFDPETIANRDPDHLARLSDDFTGEDPPRPRLGDVLSALYGLLLVLALNVLGRTIEPGRRVWGAPIFVIGLAIIAACAWAIF